MKRKKNVKSLKHDKWTHFPFICKNKLNIRSLVFVSGIEFEEWDERVRGREGEE